MSKISSVVRSIIMAAFVIVISFLCGLKLLKIQLVDGAGYLLSLIHISEPTRR